MAFFSRQKLVTQSDIDSLKSLLTRNDAIVDMAGFDNMVNILMTAACADLMKAWKTLTWIRSTDKKEKNHEESLENASCGGNNADCAHSLREW